MAEELALPKPKRKPPDFTGSESRWKLVDKVSAHVFPTNRHNPKWQTADPTDPKMDSWMIVVHNYVLRIDEIDSAIGNEYHFFGREPRVKYWGLESDKVEALKAREAAKLARALTQKDTPTEDQHAFHSLAYCRPNGVWEVFSNLEYEVNYEPVFGIRNEKNKVIEVMLSIKRRNEKGPLSGLNLTIKRE